MGTLEDDKRRELADKYKLKPGATLSIVVPDGTTVQATLSAVVEDMVGRPELVDQLPILERLAASGDSRVRADACHFLALTESREAQPLLERLSKDKARSVRETALDCLEELKDKSLD